jgi:hypothetical protein
MAGEKGFQLKLTGDGISVDRTVSADIAHQIVTIVLGAPLTTPEAPRQSSDSAVGSREAPPGAAGRSAPSVREFLLQHEAKRIPEQIATMALYLKNHRNTPVFTSKDLIKTFEDAQEPVPKNLPRDIRWTVRIGWIAPKVGLKNTYYLTSSGEAAVGAKFPADIRRKTKVTPSGHRARKRAAKAAGA